MSGKLVFCRHGQSDWNLKNLFTGWTDVELTDKGRAEAAAAGQLLHELDFKFDIALYIGPEARHSHTLAHAG